MPLEFNVAIENWITRPSTPAVRNVPTACSMSWSSLPAALICSNTDPNNQFLVSECTWDFLLAHTQIRTRIPIIPSEISFKEGKRCKPEHASVSGLTAVFCRGTDVISLNLVHAPLHLKNKTNFFQLR